MAGQQKTRMLIRDGEWVAVHAVARAELPFEVRGPQVIRVARGDRDHARVLMRPTAGALVHQPAAREEIGDRARRRPLVHRGVSRREDLEQLPRAPEGMLAAQCAELLGARLGNPVRAVMRGATPARESRAALLGIVPQGRRDNAAELFDPCEGTIQRCASGNELGEASEYSALTARDIAVDTAAPGDRCAPADIPSASMDGATRADGP